MIKAVFFDLDWTLFSHRSNRVPQSSLQALDMLRENGIRTVLCTGRSVDELRELGMFSLPVDGYVLLNGQLVLDHEQNLIAGFPFHDAARETLLKIFTEKEMPLILMEKEDIYISFVNDTVRTAQAAVHTSIPAVRPYSGEDFYMAVAFFPPSSRERTIPGCTVTEWFDGAADVIPAGAGKQVGMQAYMDAFGIAREEIMAFGDADNDIDMLAFAGIGIAMGNGCENAKKTADYVTADIDEDGIFRALVHFGLISGGSI